MAKKGKNSTAEKLRVCRRNCGLSQLQVATALGVDRSTISGYEGGRTEPNLETIVKLAQVFRVDPTEILPSEKDDSTQSTLKDGDTTDSAFKPIYSLTKDEQALLISYRLLTDKEKSRILAKITNMSANNK